MDIEALTHAAAQVGDRWTPVLLAALLDGARTFGELERVVAGISPAVLSARLRELEAHGIVVAEPYQDRPVRYRYDLTDRGASLRRALEALAVWGGGEAQHDACGSTLHLQWWCPTCERAVEPDDAELHRL